MEPSIIVAGAFDLFSIWRWLPPTVNIGISRMYIWWVRAVALSAPAFPVNLSFFYLNV